MSASALPRLDGQLPGPLTARALTPADAHAVFTVMAEQERHDIGQVAIEEADIVGDWSRPSFDVAASTVGVFDGDRLVGYAELSEEERSDVAVHPDFRGRGVGTALAGWVRELARTRGASRVGMPVPAGSAGDRLLAALGYAVRWESWLLELPAGVDVPAVRLPSGYVVRAADAGEHDAGLDLVETAFLEFSERERWTVEDLRATTVRRPGFEPWHFRVAVDAAGELAGVCLVQMSPDEVGPTGFVSHLAVRRSERGQGLAQALLADAFAEARRHGATRCELSTDSRTGALGLYEKVGMRVFSTWVHRAIDLR